MEKEDVTPAAVGVLKGWAAIIASIAALVTAVGAILKPTDTSATKATYETLSKAVKDNSEAAARNHDDLVALRAYMEGMRQSQIVPPPTTGTGVAPPPMVDATGLKTMKKPPLLGAYPPPPPVLSAPPPPPTIHKRPDVWAPPEFGEVTKKK